jgi:MFS family permease
MTRTAFPPAVWVLIGGDVVSSFGTGMILPLNLIYLHEVRGIPLAEVGALLALASAVSLVTVPLSGVAIDRLGARRIYVLVLVVQALSQGALGWAHSAATALPGLLLLGASMGPSFPAFASTMAGLCPDPARQQRAFAVNFTGVNIGFGLGGVVAAAVADVRHPASFQWLYLANGFSCLLFALALSRLPNIRPAHEPGSAKRGYREVLSQRGLRSVIIASLVLAFTGYAALDTGLPAYGTAEAHVTVTVIALSMTVNTAVIVCAQLIVLRVIRRLRRSRALAVVGLIWGLAWAILGLSALPAPSWLRVGCVLAFAGLFGLGETFMAPTISPLINHLADDRIRGRANALSSATYSVAFVVSPAVSTSMIAVGFGAAWIVLLCAGCLATVALAVGLGRRLTGTQDHVEVPVTRQPETASA